MRKMLSSLVALASLVAPAAAQDGVGPPLGRLVGIGDRHLHLHCTGSGSPTVVIEAGASSFSIDFSLVQPEVSKTTRVCSYDRAGSGWRTPARMSKRQYASSVICGPCSTRPVRRAPSRSRGTDITHTRAASFDAATGKRGHSHSDAPAPIGGTVRSLAAFALCDTDCARSQAHRVDAANDQRRDRGGILDCRLHDAVAPQRGPQGHTRAAG